MAMITYIDKACSETEKNLKNVYRSKHLKKKVSLSHFLCSSHVI